MSIRTYSLKCLADKCGHTWVSTRNDRRCPFCGSHAVADLGKGRG